MKDKTLFIAVCVISFLTLLFTGCQNSTPNNLEENAVFSKFDVKTQVDIVNIRDVENDDDFYLVTIGMSPAGYRLSKKHKNAEAYFELIKSAFEQRTPLKVVFDKTGGLIERIEESTEIEKKSWKSTKGKIWENEVEVERRTLEDLERLNVGSRIFGWEFPSYAAIFPAFNAIKAKTCDNNPYSNEPGCISFAFKRDGCYARAHRMLQILEDQFSKSCFKLFVYANGANLNIPGCPGIGWTYHVAPIVKAVYEDDWYVLDPSLNNNKPLTIAEWFAYMGASNICESDVQNPEIYGPSMQSCNGNQTYVTDPGYYYANAAIASNFQNEYGCTY